MTGQQINMHKEAAVMAEAALKSLPMEKASEASRLMILCRKCVQVGSISGPSSKLGTMDLAGLSAATLPSCLLRVPLVDL